MTELTGVPVTAVARINVVWLDTLRGFSAITIAAAVVYQRLFGGSPATVGIALAGTGPSWASPGWGCDILADRCNLALPAAWPR
jgi:hypothetical protein